MPLARILTAYPERAQSLAQQLKDQGYSVEFLGPEKAGMLRADLEIDFEICDQKVVLHRAAELANKLHADIAVSPDALPANFAPVESQVANAQVANSKIYVGENEIVEVPSHIPDPFVESFLSQGERTGQIRNLEKSDLMVSLPPDMLNVEPAQKIEAQPATQPEPVRNMMIDIPIVPDPERHAEGSYGFETQSAHASSHQINQINDESDLLRESGIHIEEPKTPWLERAGAMSSAVMATGKQKSAEVLMAAKRLGSDCAEWINIRMAAAQDRRHQRQIEAEKKREIARVRAEELEVARDAAAARLQELLRERGGLTDRQPIPPTASPLPTYQTESQVAPGHMPIPGRFERASAWFARFKEIAVSRKYGQQWEAVLMGVAAACALFVVGVAVNSFRPHPALSNTLTQPSSLTEPVSAKATSANPAYNGVTVQTGTPGVTLKPATPKPTAAQPIQTASDKPSPRESDVTIRHFGNKPGSHRADGGIAQDVTIRHFNSQPRSAARNADGVKRFSDLD